MHYWLCFIRFRMKVLQNGRLVRFSKSTAGWCAFGWGVCNQKTATSLGVSVATVSKVLTAYTCHGKTSSAERNSDRNLKLSEKDRRTLKKGLKVTELLQQRWEQNSVPIFKTLFPQIQSDEIFTNPTSTVELQLLNLWTLKITPECEKDCVSIIKIGS